jgi:hypothetical protein
MLSFRRNAAILALCLIASPAHTALAQSPAEIEAPDKLSRMFAWLNEGMRTPGAYTNEAFAERITGDAALIIDGVEMMRTPGGWAARFHALQQVTDAMEIVLPSRYAFQVGNSIYTYHVIRVRAQGRVACMLAAGHAEFRGELISRITLVQSEIAPASDKDCWKR